MATATTGRVSAPASRAPQGQAGFAGTLRSEFTKIRSVRSTYWTLFALLVVSIGIGAVASWGIASHWSRMPAVERASIDLTQTSLGGLLYLGQLVIVVLGALTITSEYSTGMIRTSLSAMPRRGVIYGAKAAVFAVIALITALITSFIEFFVGQALLGSTHHSATLSQPNVLRAVIGSALYVALCGLFAYGIGTILRHTAGSITTGIGLLFVLPILADLLPSSWRIDVVRWLPSSAGSAISATAGTAQPHMFSSWGEFAVFGCYTAAVLIAGAILFRKRDA